MYIYTGQSRTEIQEMSRSKKIVMYQFLFMTGYFKQFYWNLLETVGLV